MVFVSDTAVSILGIGAVTALGEGIEALRAGLAGTHRPRIEIESVALPDSEIRLPVYRAGTEGLSRFASKRELRRLDAFSRMALLAAFLAREDAAIEWPDPSRIAVVFGSGYGPLGQTFAFQDSMIDDGDKCASPACFATSVHNVLASQVSIAMRIEGPCQTIAAFGQTAAAVLSTAQGLLERDEADYVLAGVGEEYTPVVGYCVARRARDREGSPLQPFLLETCSYAPGEGYVVFLLGRETSEGRCGKIERVSMGAWEPGGVPTGLDALFLAANGDRDRAEDYRRAIPTGVPCAAYAPLYGSMPTGTAFDAAIAAISIADAKLYAPPDAATGSGGLAVVEREADLPAGARIGCLSCDGDDRFSLAILSR
ncbi:beta-ketoacyl synthase chain length factor [Candidatus Sumerlaeota bacterium]|nr:beta-ketoacyl synthase chain length factor [Candidatus Sumerlaeota bacterium]